MIETETLIINGQTFIMHPFGALFWKEQSILLIADVHFGKIMHFRKHGSAVPREAILKNFNQLQNVCSYFVPKSICFLGDLFHSTKNHDWILFKKWSQKIDAHKILIVGNHDIIDPIEFEKLHFKLYDKLLINDILLTHFPQEEFEYFNIAGHIHPGIKLRGTGKQILKLSCFYVNKNQIILPAFGNFTGNHFLKIEKTDSIYVSTKTKVIKLDLD